MRKSSKKKNKVPKITEEQYADYLSALRAASEDTPTGEGGKLPSVAVKKE